MSLPSLQFIIDLAYQAGAILMQGYGDPRGIFRKGTFDLVTEYDHRSEEFLIAQIRKEFPNHQVIAEESGSNHLDSEHCWYIDPLDGTVNFAHGVPYFSVSIAYAYRGALKLGAVFNPTLNECFSAEHGCGAQLNGSNIHVSETNALQDSLLVTGFPIKNRNPATNNLANYGLFAMNSQGVRRLGSASLDLCYVACSRFDGYWELFLNQWDLAAGALIVEEAGGLVTTAHGEEDYLHSNRGILATNPAMHPILLTGLLEGSIS